MRIVLTALVALTLAACSEPPPPIGPPEGWVTDGSDRWFLPEADTASAFRDLSTISAMGIARDGDTEFVRWTQEELTELYRTNPEVVDSVFGAEFLDEIRAGAPAGENYEEAARSLVNDVKRDFYQRYNPPLKQNREEGYFVPDSLLEVTGAVVLQIYVNADNQPVAIRKLEGTGTALDDIVMRDAALSSFTDSWVRETAGRSEGKKIPAWVRIRQAFGEAG
ncbi:MAG: hypothetical protein AAF170_09800 [Bacteroidota bacterium]